MARTKLSETEKENRKLSRRAAKKASRKSLKDITAAVDVSTKKGKNKNPFKLIEVAVTDTVANKKLNELRESGVPIKSNGYVMGHFIYKVPSTLEGYTLHGKGEQVITNEDTVPEIQVKTLADCITKIETEMKDGRKINKRFIKLLVRGSELKRNIKKESLTILLTKFKIK